MSWKSFLRPTLISEGKVISLAIKKLQSVGEVVSISALNLFPMCFTGRN